MLGGAWVGVDARVDVDSGGGGVGSIGGDVGAALTVNVLLDPLGELYPLRLGEYEE